MRLIGLAVILALSLMLAPLGAVPDAQEHNAGKIPRIGVLAPGSPPSRSFDSLRHGLRELGYVEGRTILIEPRWDEGRPERNAALAGELVRLNVDIIVATTTALTAAAKATKEIPIVMTSASGDPVTLGLAASLSRPGGNVTGLTLQTYELPGKRLQLLKEALPRISRVVLFWDPASPSSTEVREYEIAARSLGLQLQAMEVRGREDLDAAFQTAVRARAQAVIMVQSAIYSRHTVTLASIALKSRLPTMSGETGYAQDGGLMNYGPNIPDSWRRAAGYVDKILKGAKPADLPIEQPTKFELVINLKTAKAIGLTIPHSLLVRADAVIQ
jgi:ABC-type uncharacterized transport system substrate-binding protein